MKRIHIPNMGPNRDTIPTAIAIGVKEAKAIGADQVMLITPAKNNLDTIVVGEFLGTDVSKRLMKGQNVAVGNHGVTLSHESVSTAAKKSAPAVGLAFYVSNEQIMKLDDMRFQILIFVPWLDEDGIQWARKWNAETYGSKTEGSKINLPAEVETSLKGLTASVNLSTGLSHPSDKEHAKRKFSELRSSGIAWEPKEIERWAARNGWRVADAAELSKLSARYT